MLSLSLFFLFSVILMAQRFGYVDTEYVLNSLPQYANAQSKVDTQATNWAKEISNQENELERDMLAFETEKVLLTKEQITTREAEIENQRQSIAELKQKRYGPTGDLISLRKNLVKPIQDQVWNVVKQVAERRNYSFVFDKGSDLIMIYSDPKYDISEEVLRKLLPENAQPVRTGSDVRNQRSTQSSTRKKIKSRNIN
ncbi:OmpH family outer membrane protein [Flavobacteriaceae bacterium Ap0902]|nr:OmpH family outer membrane protein [Flavobacteriaceae bacterium Ap0902]